MTTKSTLYRLWDLLNMEKKEITSIYFFAILSGLVQLSLPLGVQTIVGLMMGTTMVTSIYLLIIVVVGGVFMVGWLQVSQMRVIEKIQQRLFTRYAFEFADVIPKLKLNKTNDYYLPEKTNRFFDTITVQKGLAKLLLDVPLAGIQIVFGLTLLSLYHPAFILFGLSLVAILWAVLRSTAKAGLASSLIESKYKYAVAGWLEEIARIVIPIKYSKKSKLNFKRTDDNVVGYLLARTKHFNVLLLQYKTLIFFKVAITLAMLSVGTYLVVNQQLNIGEFIAAELVILMVIAAVEKLIGSLDNVYDVITGVEKLSTVTELPVEKSGSLEMEENKAVSITLEDVSYAYDDNKYILKDLNLHIPAGAKVWIAGDEGSGKSTLLKLLGCCFDDYSGAILYNKIPVLNYNLPLLRAQISLYLNHNDIFLGTVFENITLGNTSVKATDIVELAGKLGMEDFLQTFPNGFDTMIDPTGKKLTESTIKKLLLLRTFVGRNKLLLLNAPFDGIDQKIKQSILKYISSLNDCTVIMASNDEQVKQISTHCITLQKGMVTTFNTL